MLYFSKASPSSTAVADVIEVWLLFQKKNGKALKKLNFVCTIIGFKEVYFVGGGVDFFNTYTLCYSHSFYILPHSFQEAEQIGNHNEKRR